MTRVRPSASGPPVDPMMSTTPAAWGVTRPELRSTVAIDSSALVYVTGLLVAWPTASTATPATVTVLTPTESSAEAGVIITKPLGNTTSASTATSNANVPTVDGTFHFHSFGLDSEKKTFRNGRWRNWSYWKKG